MRTLVGPHRDRLCVKSSLSPQTQFCAHCLQDTVLRPTPFFKVKSIKMNTKSKPHVGVRPEKQGFLPSCLGMVCGRHSKAIPTPRHPSATRATFRSIPCLHNRPHSARSRFRVWISAGRCSWDARQQRRGHPERVQAAPRPSHRLGSRPPNQGAARARAAANQERRERRQEPAGAELA